jgi:hypothetical protein
MLNRLMGGKALANFDVQLAFVVMPEGRVALRLEKITRRANQKFVPSARPRSHFRVAPSQQYQFLAFTNARNGRLRG